MRRKTNPIIIYEDYAEVVLFGIRGGSVFVDLCDVERISEHCWANKDGWTAEARINGKCDLLHRFIMEAKKGEKIITNRTKPFDFRRCNLLLVRGCNK